MENIHIRLMKNNSKGMKEILKIVKKKKKKKEKEKEYVGLPKH